MVLWGESLSQGRGRVAAQPWSAHGERRREPDKVGREAKKNDACFCSTTNASVLGRREREGLWSMGQGMAGRGESIMVGLASCE